MQTPDFRADKVRGNIDSKATVAENDATVEEFAKLMNSPEVYRQPCESISVLVYSMVLLF
jgi:hypothetical protein